MKVENIITPKDKTPFSETSLGQINFISQLSPEQIQAVRCIDSSSIISAGAGSGKTRVLTYKIAYLISIGIPKSNILALTFTNKAANEMKERVMALLPNHSLDGLWMGTFHSIFLRILRENKEYLKEKYNLNQQFLIYDQKSKFTLLEIIIEKIVNEYKEAKRKNERIIMQKILFEISDDISKIKNEGKTLDECLNDNSNIQFNLNSKSQLKSIYQEYCKKCLILNALDFDDILLFTYKMLKDREEIAEKYRKKFKYILIDEYQDTNTIQFNIINLLHEKDCKICVVGDDSQCIYSFRGSKIENIQKFIKKYSPVEYKLTVNYRSTKTIVNAANNLIQYNKGQSFKILNTNSEKNYLTENKIKIISAEDNNKEARKVIEKIIELRNKNMIENNWGSFAILYRTHKQSVPFETQLKNFNIPYEIVGKINFLEKEIIEHILCYLRILINETDNIALQKIFNLSFKDINLKIKKIFDKADKDKNSYWYSINNIDLSKEKEFNKIESFIKLINYLKNKIDYENPLFFIEKIIEYIKSIKSLNRSSFNEEDEESINLLKCMTQFLMEKYNNNKKCDNNPDEFNESEKNVRSNNNYINKSEKNDPFDNKLNENFDLNKNIKVNYNLKEFLDDLILLNTNEDLSESMNNKLGIKNNAVKLMTIHSSKGLEFNTVFIVGVEQGNYPIFHPNVKDKNKHEEEERRMFYVALTRAEQNCFISYAQTKLSENGKIIKRKKSQFIDELENECLDFSEDCNINIKNNMESFKNSKYYQNFSKNINQNYFNKSKSYSYNNTFGDNKTKNFHYFKKSYSNNLLGKKRYSNFENNKKNK